MQEVSSKLGVIMFLLVCARRSVSIDTKVPEAVSKSEEEQSMNISNHGTISCPPWSYLSNGSCSCKIFNDPLKCEINANTEDVSVLDCYCATHNGASKFTEVGHCPYNCAGHRHHTSIDVVYHRLPHNVSEWNNYMCGKFSRSGTLCGSCDYKNNFYPRTYSFDYSCIKYEHGSSQGWKYVIAAYFPLTAFCFVILILKVDIQSSPVRGFVMLSQILTIPAQTRITLLAMHNKPKLLCAIKLLAACAGIWNLDFFRVYQNNICLGLGSLATLFLDLAVAVYPMMVIAITYILIDLYDHNYRILILLWKPLRFLLGRFYKKLSIKSSIIDSITTFMFLANIKVLSVCFDALTPVQVYQIHSSGNLSISWRLYYDPSIHYFSSEHRCYAAVALTILFFMYFCPLLILCFHSCRFYKAIISLLPNRLQIFYNTFTDSFYGCYKDGTEPGSTDRRWYALVWPITRGLIGTLYSISLSASFSPFAAMVVTLVVISIIVADPYKPHLKHLSSSMSTFILFIGVFYVGYIAADLAAKTQNSSHINIIYVTLIVTLPLPFMFVSLVTLRHMSPCRRN